MNEKRIEIINPNKDDHIELLNDFCLRNNIDNVAKIFKQQKKENQLPYHPFIDTYLGLFANNTIVDYCYIHGERDLGQCFLEFPQITEKRPTKKRKLVALAIDYAFQDLGMENVFIKTTGEDPFLAQNLQNLGFLSLGKEANSIIYMKTKEEVVKEKVI